MTYTLGIDLGTTYTAAAVVRSGRPEPVALGYRATAVPTVVFLGEDGRFLIGDAAERRASSSPDRVTREFKRRVGDPTPLFLGGTPVAVDRCLAEVLHWVATTVTETEGRAPAGVSVTHPANWGEFKRDILREALRLAELPEAHLLPEPVAAATWYAQVERLAPGSTVVVYDLGGGTFDAAVVRRGEDGTFAMLGRSEGIERLGGIDVDQAVLGHVLRSLGLRDPSSLLESEDPATLAMLSQLKRACVEAKEALSSETSVTIPVWLPDLQHQVLLRRSELEELVLPLLAPTVDSVRRVVASAGLTPDDLSAVLLVGGSSRIPMITRQVSAGLGRPVAVDAHPKHPVAMGAALDAEARLEPAYVPPPSEPPRPPFATPVARPHPTPPPPPPRVGADSTRRTLQVAIGVVAAIAVGVVVLIASSRGENEGGREGQLGSQSESPGVLDGPETAADGGDSGDDASSSGEGGPAFVWQAALGEETTGQVVTVDAERVYQVDDRGLVTALSRATGAVAWTRDLGEESTGARPVLAGGHLLVSVSEPGATYALDPATGELRWTAETWMDPPTVVGDLVFGHTGNATVGLALDTGAVRWESTTEAWAWADPVFVNGIIVTASSEGQVAGIDPGTGDQLWIMTVPRGSVTIWDIAAVGDGVVVVDEDLWVTMVNTDGSVRWNLELGANTFGPAVAVGEVFALSLDGGGVGVVDPATGDMLHTMSQPGIGLVAAPGETPGIVTSSGRAIQAFDLEGNQLWSVDAPIDVYELVVEPGVIVGSNSEGELALFEFPD